MKKLFFLFICIIVFSSFTFAQEQYGNIRGVVVDEQGEPLPGITVTLESELYNPRVLVTTEGGIFRFLNVSVGPCRVKCEMSGFKTYIQENIEMTVGFNVDLRIRMEIETPEEEVIVIAKAPVVDTKKTGTSTTFTYEMLQEIPSARDPWVIFQHTPGVFVTQENVGGSHSGMQSAIASKGAFSRQVMFNIDGVLTNDPVSRSSSRYFDFDSFEEIELITSGADASVQAPGVSINMVTRRGTNSLRASARMFFINDDLQADNRTQELIDLEYVGNRITRIMDYGLQLGGPIFKDKLWFWVGYGVQDIRRLAVNGYPDLHNIESINAKLNFQIHPKNRAELAFIYNNKSVDGHKAGPSRPPETTLYQTTTGNPLFKFEDEHMFSDKFLLSLKIAVAPFNAYTEEPKGGFDTTIAYDLGTRMYSGTAFFHEAKRSSYAAQVEGNLFLEKILGGDHEIKFGAQYRLMPNSDQNYYPQNIIRYYWNGQPFRAQISRERNYKMLGTHFSLHFNDAYIKKRFTLNLGLRLDYDKSVIKATQVAPSQIASDFLPGFTSEDINPQAPLLTLSPRLGFTYSLTEDNKTILRGHLARYAHQVSAALADHMNPATRAWARYYWTDSNNDDKVTTDELIGYPLAGLIGFGGFDPFNPTLQEDPDKIDPDLRRPVTDELLVGVEREVFPDFSLSTTLCLRRSHNFHRTLYYDKGTGWKESSSDWIGPIQDSITYNDVIYDYEYWTLNQFRPAGTLLENRPDYHRNYWGIEIAAQKRLSHKWMMNTSFTFQRHTERYGDEGFTDPTNIDKWDGASVDYDSRWMAKISALYQLPWGFNLSAFANLREGTVFWQQILVATPERGVAGIGSTTSLHIGEKWDDTRLPTFFNCDISLVKEFKTGKLGRIHLQVDAFNVFNFAHVLSRVNQVNSTRFNDIQQTLNPRVIRLGVRYSY